MFMLRCASPPLRGSISSVKKMGKKILSLGSREAAVGPDNRTALASAL